MSTNTRRTAAGVVALWAGLVSATAAAVNEPPKAASDAAKRDANAMNRAFLKGDFEAFARYTHPAMVKMAGSKKKLIEALQKSIAELKSQGYQIISASAGAPLNMVNVGDELQAIVPQEQVIDVPAKHGELHGTSYMLGVSRDGGKTWTFINVDGMTREQVRQVLPTFSASLDIPSHPPPTFVSK
jgi:hypothetical protein